MGTGERDSVRNRWGEGIASYVTVQIEYLVAIVDSDGPSPDEPHLESTDQEDEIGQPERDEEEELEDMVTNNMIPKPVSNLLLRLYGERRGKSRG